jgi:hypothetical protein
MARALLKLDDQSCPVQCNFLCLVMNHFFLFGFLCLWSLLWLSNILSLNISQSTSAISITALQLLVHQPSIRLFTYPYGLVLYSGSGLRQIVSRVDYDGECNVGASKGACLF